MGHPSYRRMVGSRGEALAEAALRQRGYEIIARNWRCREGEVDLVARDGADWVFVEVRTRCLGDGPSPEESLTQRKRRRLLRLAGVFLEAQGLQDVPWRVDVVAVELDRKGRPLRLEVLPGAVTAEGVDCA
ncbi:MAG: YraN family protein [Chloroflexia bacterium]